MLGLGQCVERSVEVDSVTPVVFDKWQFNRSSYPLKRGFALHEARAQHFMSIERRLPCRLEAGSIKIFQIQPELIDVHRPFRLENAVKQHPGLHRRQWIEVSHAIPWQPQSVESILADPGQREVRRRHTLRAVQAVLDQVFQFIQEPSG
ncbi:hypothetical protein LMG26854_06158 [Achromobacter aegrifaciens]|nr:hypothetical protein LMG26854_06158 [Achromobacter aegrifaciens]